MRIHSPEVCFNQASSDNLGAVCGDTVAHEHAVDKLARIVMSNQNFLLHVLGHYR
jgi:hypothetical protein